MTTYFKVTDRKGEAISGGTGVWHLPSGKRPGKWMPEVPNPVPCERGYHLVTLDQLLDWLGPRIWVAEFGPGATVVDHGDKSVGSKARLVARTGWDERTARLFAADCAERVLPIFEADHPGDARPRQAIEVARRYANGAATDEQLDAARHAAWAAVRAARAAVRAARDAAGAAAWAAAGVAARAAAGAAAGVAARDAAWAAARDAAWAAAGAAAGAAWAAERQWQAERLAHYLHGEA